MNPLAQFLVAILAGYMIGFAARKQNYRIAASILLLVLGIVLFVVSGVVAASYPGVRDQMIDLERVLLHASMLFVLAAGASAGWALIDRPLVAAVIGLFFAVVAGSIWMIVLLQAGCRWLGDCI